MNYQSIDTKEYKIDYNPDASTINFVGELSLNGASEYDPIKNFLDRIADSEPSHLTLNLKELNFLNSSGISLITKFVIGLRKKPNIKLTVEGSVDVPWQGKSLKNLQKFLPNLELIVE
ncbi:hypothetical protein PMG71_19190 [Roseofilum sp. BLCC_M154]|uniref:STAS domain-containing protein n=1 Tax=Roseofilum acuticapitatum BLCC-M154 TaxID=3022444 RepID=A0ABT7AYN3_9CYAN|nr:hypothetical protein [Roseofilum acuticapitatum]MDJ1171559.1 hypothetical protein [Roseofilum acuticapitatum BLCC-M154]